MNQSALVGGALLAGFALFLAARDRLTVYGNVLWGAPSAGNGPAPSTGSAVIPSQGSNPSNANTPTLGQLLNPFDWTMGGDGNGMGLPSLPSIPDLGHFGI